MLCTEQCALCKPYGRAHAMRSGPKAMHALLQSCSKHHLCTNIVAYLRRTYCTLTNMKP